MKVNIWYLKSHEIFTVAELKQKISTGEKFKKVVSLDKNW